MNDAMVLRVLSYNLRGARSPAPGLDARQVSQMQGLARVKPHVACFQEARFFGENYRRSFYEAEAILGMRGVLVSSAHHSCDLAVFVDPHRVRIIEERHEIGHPFWHSLARLRCVVAGLEVDLVSVHLAPSAASVRVGEAESLDLLTKADGEGSNRKRLVIMGGDFNAVPVDHEGEVEGPKGDRRPALELARQGWVDAGEAGRDPTPTVGHLRAGQLAYRCDRILSTLPAQALAAYFVITDMDGLSDHRPVAADYMLPVAGRAGAGR